MDAVEVSPEVVLSGAAVVKLELDWCRSRGCCWRDADVGEREMLKKILLLLLQKKSVLFILDKSDLDSRLMLLF